jgi:hypothetical protein
LFYYVWLVLKNLIGWTLILISGPVGVTFPGPGGFPLFVIGFAMITLPGKRALTGRVLRGRPWRMNSTRVVTVEVLAALFLPAGMMWFVSMHLAEEMQRHAVTIVCTVYALAVVASFLILRLGLRAVNFGLTFVPAIRRKVRPWMRHHGIDLLPPRRRKRLQQRHGSIVNTLPGDDGHEPVVDTGILEVDGRYRERLKSLYRRVRFW